MRRTFTPEQIFNKLRDELLNREIFTTMAEVKILISNGSRNIIMFDHIMLCAIGCRFLKL